MPRTATKTASQAKRTSRNSQKADTSEKKVPKKRGSKSSSITDNLSTETSNDDIARIVRQATRNMMRKPPESNEELSQRIDDYFETTIENKEIPTVEGLAKACGVCRETLHEWQTVQKRMMAYAY